MAPKTKAWLSNVVEVGRIFKHYKEKEVEKGCWSKFWRENSATLSKEFNFGEKSQPDRYIKIFEKWDDDTIKKIYEGKWYELPRHIHKLYNKVMAFNKPQVENSKKLEAERKKKAEQEKIVKDAKECGIDTIPKSMMNSVIKRNILTKLLDRILLNRKIAENHRHASEVIKKQNNKLEIQLTKAMANKFKNRKNISLLNDQNRNLINENEELKYQLGLRALTEPPRKRPRTTQHTTN